MAYEKTTFIMGITSIGQSNDGEQEAPMMRSCLSKRREEDVKRVINARVGGRRKRGRSKHCWKATINSDGRPENI